MISQLAQIVDTHAPTKVVPLGPQNLSALDFRLMKLYPAYNIIMAARRAGKIGPQTEIVETSSGTMALGLAIVGRFLDLKVTVFGDPAIEPPLKRTMEDLGATIRIVEAQASDGNVQKLRKKALLDFMNASPDAFWTRQYDNLDNRRAYSRPAEEIIRQHGRVDALVAPVGSGGSSSGLALFLRKCFPEMKLIGVDTFNSILFGQPAGNRALRGLGNSVMPTNLNHSQFDEVHWIGAAEAFHATLRLHRDSSLRRGPTSGAAYQIAKWYAERNPEKRVLVVFPDDAVRYEHTVFDPAWMTAQGYDAAPRTIAPTLVKHPSEATERWCRIRWSRQTLECVMNRRSALGEVKTS